MLSDVASHFAASHREANKHKILELQMSDNLMQVFRKRVVVVARGRLARFPEPTPVVCDHAIPCLKQHWYLFLPRRTAEWIAMDQHDRLSGPMVFVVKMDRSGVFFSDINV